jgi:UDP-N-acetylglucosamine--N-acetylmuramyl-(pentapeptide) pyrophosphoryl-undecaprenol N-acetylglucosamine transferase
VGAEGRMEMHRVPAAGYPIKGLPAAGFDRKNLFKNIPVLIKLFKSQRLARKIVKDFQPHAAVGVGGYASGPTLKVAGSMGIPTLLQEQNSYAGVTNKLLAKQAKKICVAYEGMERFFDKDKILLTGNPVRQGLLNHSTTREEAISTFGLDPNKRTILILGGSLGARTINQCLMENLDKVKSSGVQFIWQTGKIYIEEAKAAVAKAGELPMLHVTDFISDMATAYCAADLVISRAGAGSISEFCLLQKPVILVPSPNVAEDHQTKNALALVNKNAALYVKDIEAKDLLLDKAIEAVKQPDLLKNLSKNITELAFTDSANIIAKEVIKLAEKYKEEHGC